MKKIMMLLLGLCLTLSGCDTVKRRNFLVLIDNSTSITEEVMQKYITVLLETVLPKMGDKDEMTIMFVDACSQNMAERVYNLNLAEMDFTDKRDGINHREDSCHARLKRYVDVTSREEIARVIMDKRAERAGCGKWTDLISAINESQKLVENKKSYSGKVDKLLNEAKGDDNYEYQTCLLLFSDMVNENPAKTFDFTTFGTLKAEDINKKVDQVRELNKIPDLAGVKVLVFGATSSKEAGAFGGKQIENVKLFWDLFFQSAGADVIGYGYDSKIELQNYLANN